MHAPEDLAAEERPGAAAAPGRLDRLRAARREPGEASHFWHDAHFGIDAVKVLPGEWFVAAEDILISTTLGSCIAACLWDRRAGIGGLNHFMLAGSGEASGRYGAYAMEQLVNAMMKRGASRSGLEAKVFGGGRVISGPYAGDAPTVGERNTRFVLDYLEAERIPLVAKDVLDVHARKVLFLPASGRALVKRLLSHNPSGLLARERAAAARAVPLAAGGGAIDLFAGPP